MANKKTSAAETAAEFNEAANSAESLMEETAKKIANGSKAAGISSEELADKLPTNTAALNKAVGLTLEEAANGIGSTINVITQTKRIYVYIGPSIKGVITSGSIFSGDKKEILSRIEVNAKAAGTESLMENIGRLIFADANVAAARDKLKAGGNSLSIAYNAVAAGKEGL